LLGCAECHRASPPAEKPASSGERVHERARALATRLEAKGGGAGDGPPHARGGAGDARRARAEWLVRLVLEDPAAGVHNAPFARALLDEAERALR
jgi:hypothetical protein